MLLIACDANLELSGWTKHIYRNNSNHKIEPIAYVNEYEYPDLLLKSDEEIVFDLFASEGEDNPPQTLPRYARQDSVVTIFDDTLAIMYDRGRLDSELCESP